MTRLDYSETNDILTNEDSEFYYYGIKQYINARYVSAPEAIHRIYEFPIHGISHVIIRLAVHLEF